MVLSAVQLMVLVGLIHTFTGVQSFSFSMDWLRSDGTHNFFSLFEGDTAICRCLITTATPFATAEFQWKQYGRDDKSTIAQGEQITYFDSQNRFSDANLTVVNENTTDYRITISNIDRYDSGLRFFCSFAWPPESGVAGGSIATGLKVRWSRPITQCSSDVNEKGTVVSYRCSAVDTDGRSSNMGSITMWKNNNKVQATTTYTELEVGSLYNASYATQITYGSVQDVYTCRYQGTGGFEVYNSNCTFNKGVLTSCDHFNIAIGLSILIIYSITM